MQTLKTPHPPGGSRVYSSRIPPSPPTRIANQPRPWGGTRICGSGNSGWGSREEGVRGGVGAGRDLGTMRFEAGGVSRTGGRGDGEMGKGRCEHGWGSGWGIGPGRGAARGIVPPAGRGRRSWVRLPWQRRIHPHFAAQRGSLEPPPSSRPLPAPSAAPAAPPTRSPHHTPQHVTTLPQTQLPPPSVPPPHPAALTHPAAPTPAPHPPTLKPPSHPASPPAPQPHPTPHPPPARGTQQQPGALLSLMLSSDTSNKALQWGPFTPRTHNTAPGPRRGDGGGGGGKRGGGGLTA